MPFLLHCMLNRVCSHVPALGQTHLLGPAKGQGALEASLSSGRLAIWASVQACAGATACLISRAMPALEQNHMSGLA